MDKEIKDVLKNVMEIPVGYRTANKSLKILLQESGYRNFYDKINLEQILEVLKEDPKLIDRWLLWSGDQRWSPTTYFDRDSSDGWCFIGHVPYDKHFEEINTKDEFFACASFIMLQLEQWRKL